MSTASNGSPPGWMAIPIQELFEPLADGRTLHHGWSPQCDKDAAGDGEWGVLKTTAVQDGAFMPEHNKRLPQKLKPRARFEVKQGDLLITCAGPRVRCGVPCLVRETRERLILSGKMYRFRVRPEVVDGRYMEAYLRSPQTQRLIDQMKTGISDSGLNLTHDRFFTLRVPVAPLAEQRRIVAEIEKQFSRLDAGASALKRVEANLRRYKASVLKAACEGRLTTAWRAAHPDVEPASELLKRILRERRRRWEQAELAKMLAKGKPPKDDRWKERYEEPVGLDQVDLANLPILPLGWSWVTLGQIALIQGGIQKQPSRAPKKHAFPFLRVANVLRGRLDLTEVHRIELFGDELGKLRLETGDMLIVEGNGSRSEIGRCALWTGDIADCVHQNHVIRARPVECLPGYLNAFWNSPQGAQRVMEKAASTSGLYTLSVSKVTMLPVALPPVDEQNAVVADVEGRVSVFDEVVLAIALQQRRAGRLRQSILRDAFAGKLVPQDPADEPASALLERISASHSTPGTGPRVRGVRFSRAAAHSRDRSRRNP